jgi:hypothetical protein
VDLGREKSGVPFRVTKPNRLTPGAGKGTPMLKVLEGGAERNADEVVGATLDELAREGAQRMIRAALKLEVEDYLARHAEARDPVTGRALVVANGHGKPREVTTGAGAFKMQAPRVNDKRVSDSGERMRFRSKILPPYLRRSAKVTEVRPILYLRGLSTVSGSLNPS